VSPRKTTDEERELFKTHFTEARPHVAVQPASPTKGLVVQKRRKAEGEILPGGVDGRTEERLRKGLLEPEGSLDLHGYTETAAHDALLGFLRSAQQRGLKLVVIVTGKGAPRRDDAPFDLELDRKARGILKTVVPRWFQEPAFARFVAAIRQAHRRHGGDGAYYVYLRRSAR